LDSFRAGENREWSFFRGSPVSAITLWRESKFSRDRHDHDALGERFNERIGRALFRKELYTDPDTGMLVRLVRYPAGVINPEHTHPCGHGMYVLEGRLVTHNGTFGPGTFVWFPEGVVMEHGATAEGDVTVLFITNKPFRIDYIDAKS
jgi:quercetin dioxygenase-like cupin family protein